MTINSKIFKDYIIAEEIEGSITITASGSTGLSLNLAKTGYKPLGIIGIDTSDNNLYIGKYRLLNNTAYVTIRNIKNSAINNATYRIAILYLKN